MSQGASHLATQRLRARQDQIDAGEELFAVVMVPQLSGDLVHEGILLGRMLQPFVGDGLYGNAFQGSPSSVTPRT